MAGPNGPLEGPETESAPPKATTGAEQLRLVVVAGPDRGRQGTVGAGISRVGKSPTCALVLTDPAVSRVHLELRVGPNGVVVRDLDSKNGSYFKGARFREVTVSVGATLVLGETELRLQDALSANRASRLIGSSAPMRELLTQIERLAPTEAVVLLEGETGTGKELCAEALHTLGHRAGRPFVVCDLAGLSRSTIESELFGHKRGSFTGADRDRTGLFVEADGGTLFLDEIGELELELQPRLLRALEQRRVKPLGASAYVPIDVRVVAATNRDLREECAAGRFREDLYHRLAVLRLRVPPLRERKDDLPQLIANLLGDRHLVLPEETLAVLKEYDWPGNVRELRNVVERAAATLSDGDTILPSAIGLATPSAPALTAAAFHEAKHRLITEWERAYLQQLLERAEGNVARAARAGGLDRPYLYRLLKRHGLGVTDDTP
jgi:DNA-binding NtrC family response regulator